jgi:hypothetical protein
MNYQIKHRLTNAVLFECEVDDEQTLGLASRHALEKAVQSGANLRGANLRGANLTGANLSGADLRGAKLGDKTLVGERPVLIIGPIGSRCDYLTVYLTDAGVMLCAGCFFGTIDEFAIKLIDTHGTNDHRREYEAALVFIAAHAEIWTPKTPPAQT